MSEPFTRPPDGTAPWEFLASEVTTLRMRLETARSHARYLLKMLPLSPDAIERHLMQLVGELDDRPVRLIDTGHVVTLDDGGGPLHIDAILHSLETADREELLAQIDTAAVSRGAPRRSAKLGRIRQWARLHGISVTDGRVSKRVIAEYEAAVQAGTVPEELLP